MKHINEIRKQLQDVRFPVFKVSDLKSIEGISDGYRRVLLHNLLSRGEIVRITRGVYTFHRDADVVCFAFSPSYYGFEDALSIRGLSDQATNPIVMSKRNVRRGPRHFIGRNYLVYHVDKRLFFGYDMVKHNDFWIPVSDPEKTLIDMLYFNYDIRDELWPGILKAISKSKLSEYLGFYSARFRKRVLDEVKANSKES